MIQMFPSPRIGEGQGVRFENLRFVEKISQVISVGALKAFLAALPD
jgi:hypothetical protein